MLLVHLAVLPEGFALRNVVFDIKQTKIFYLKLNNKRGFSLTLTFFSYIKTNCFWTCKFMDYVIHQYICRKYLDFMV